MDEFLDEILSQPQALLDTYHYLKDSCQSQFQELKKKIKEEKISKFIFTGMGSSYFSSYIPYYLLNQSGFYSEMREAGEFLLYSFPKIETNFFDKTAIVLISQSGESGEVIHLLEKINSIENPPLTIGITNNPKSTLSTNTNMTFLIKAGVEKSVTSKSYTCTLLLLYVLVKDLIDDFLSKNENSLEIENLIKEINDFLKDREKIEIFYNNLLSFYGSEIDCLEILARGPSLSTAYQAALNFKEIVKKLSEANPCSTFRHGGIECLNKNSKLVIISSEQNNFKLNIHLIKRMIKDWNCGKILHITNLYSDDITLNNSPKIISFMHHIKNPFLSPIMEIIILQLFFYKIAEKNDLTPGKFYYSEKITRDI